MAEQTHDIDDGFHEIQLSGKQLVFLFMATTVISVVIFLCGVLVGRQVQAEELGVAPGLGASADAAEEPGALSPDEIIAAASAAPPEGDLRYRSRLEDGKTPETLKPRVEESAPVAEVSAPVIESATEPAAAAAEPPAPARAGAPPESQPEAAPEAKPEAAPRVTAGPQAGIWAVQVISLSDRASAMRIVQRLKSKGYPAFLIAPAPGGPTKLYKVQVGRYGDRSEAQKVEARLKKEEQFDTWIVR